MKIFDGHYHTLMQIGIEDTIQSLKRSMEENDVAVFSLLSCPFYETNENDLMQNVKNLFLKYYFGENVYAFAGVEHYLDLDKKAQSANYLAQAKEYEAAGFDGIKMLEGKPCVRKMLNNMLVSDDSYDEFYSYLEEKGTPILLHNADPCEFWDRVKCGEYTVSQGWFNDETHLPKDEMSKDVFKVMEKHPNLHLTLAHWGFLIDNYKYAEKFLGEYKYTMMDITPASQEYLRMMENYTLWREFILKYQDRIKYGTDTYNFGLDDNYLVAVHRRPDFVKRFFNTNDTFTFMDDSYRGMGLPESVLEKLYYTNGIKEYGVPKKVNVEYLTDKLNWLKTVIKSQVELKDIEFMLVKLQEKRKYNDDKR